MMLQALWYFDVSICR